MRRDKRDPEKDILLPRQVKNCERSSPSFFVHRIDNRARLSLF